MEFVFKLLVLIFILFTVESRETIGNVKIFKVNEKIIYDCVDIFKQPSLSHPLLQNHKIQMEPSFWAANPKNKVKSKNESKNIIGCPNGTVPILRNTKEYVANAQYWAERHFTPLTVDSHGTHIAGVRSQGQGPYHGLAAWMSVHDLNVSKDQTSYTNIYVGSGANNKVNYIQTGWMVNPNLFGDGRTWTYGFWKGANGAGCYNTICPGFIQVSKTNLLGGPFPGSGEGRAVYRSIQQDNESGHWWATDVRYNKRDIPVGYWPKELFDLIGNGVDMVGVMGAVQASPSGISPPMGNGHLPTEDENESARVKTFEIVDSKFKIREGKTYKLEKLLDSNKCYGLKDGKKRFFKESNLFTYGGPGGDSCGI